MNMAQANARPRPKVMTLTDDFKVMCGHGPDTTVGRERANNPFLTGLYQLGRG